jgi:copper(I)-binding protein
MITTIAAPGRRLRELAMAALAPVACAVILLVLLSSYVMGGGGGTITRVRIEVSAASIAMPSPGSRQAVTYLTLVNLGAEDRLISVTSPAARQIELVRHDGSAAGPGQRLTTVVIPANATVSLSPFGTDVVLVRPAALTFGQMLPLTLRFRHAGTITVDATVTAPGTP